VKLGFLLPVPVTVCVPAPPGVFEPVTVTRDTGGANNQKSRNVWEAKAVRVRATETLWAFLLTVKRDTGDRGSLFQKISIMPFTAGASSVQSKL
jgi:hypothetical protein